MLVLELFEMVLQHHAHSHHQVAHDVSGALLMCFPQNTLKQPCQAHSMRYGSQATSLGAQAILLPH